MLSENDVDYFNAMRKNAQTSEALEYAVKMEQIMERLRKTEELARKAEEGQRQAEELARKAEEGQRQAEERAREVEENPEKAVMMKKIQCLRDEQKANGNEIYYENQSVTAIEVVATIRDRQKVFQMVLAPCQSGKTGCMLAIIEMLMESDINVKPEHIFVITGLSDTEWVTQTKTRVPIGNNVIHRGKFQKSRDIFRNIKNAVIFIDECQIACRENMSLDKLLDEVGLKDVMYLKDNNVNIVEFSATPNSTINDIEMWGKFCKKHLMKPGDGYKGHSTLISNNRIHQSNDLFIDFDPEAGLSHNDEVARKKVIKPAEDAIESLKCMIEKSYISHARFHIIRTPTADKSETVVGRFKKIFGRDNYDYKKCDGEGEKLMVELSKNLDKHTFIFIKEKARCAVTFTRKHMIGILYDRVAKKPKDDIAVQGLAGRACGYDVDDGMIVYTNVKSIERYVAMLNSNFEERDDFTFLKTLKNSHLHPGGYKNADGEVNIVIEEHDKKDCKFVIHDIIFEDFNQAKEFVKSPRIWKDCMKLDSAPRVSNKAWEGSRSRCSGFAVSSILNKKQTMSASDRVLISNTPGPGTCLSSKNNNRRYLILPVYESMETPHNKEKYQVRYIKYNV